ncbi:glucosaminidase domain-containing protein [Roseivirga pacifica]|uniref:glucosaminidase domain-containing protein n=1 Tax=Roseivirga pacifica TaxID=1267423 RepID=UPI003BB1F887
MRTERIVAISFLTLVFILGIVNYTTHLTPEHREIHTVDGLVQSKVVNPSSPDDILPITDKVKPILYTEVGFMEELPHDEIKEKFIDIMLPAILVAKYELAYQQEQVRYLSENHQWSNNDSLFIQTLFDTYDTSDLDDLHMRLETHPSSIVLAQAAIETGWGKSRFFREANNVFGIWSYDPNEPRIPAAVSREDYRAYLKKFETISASIKGYFMTIAKANAYSNFRAARMETQNVDELTAHLVNYSEMREEYVEQLNAMIRINKFKKYDKYTIDPLFINR